MYIIFYYPSIYQMHFFHSSLHKLNLKKVDMLFDVMQKGKQTLCLNNVILSRCDRGSRTACEKRKKAKQLVPPFGGSRVPPNLLATCQWAATAKKLSLICFSLITVIGDEGNHATVVEIASMQVVI